MYDLVEGSEGVHCGSDKILDVYILFLDDARISFYTSYIEERGAEE